MDTNYDDGLVHGHNWSSEPAIPAKPQGTEIAAPAISPHSDDGTFDDGLVHSHDWARN